MRRIAVTGTNGKTSTVEFVRQLLEATGERAASYGTLGLVTAEGREPDPRISFGPRAIPSFLSRREHEGFDAVALEAYSSSLATEVFDRVTVDVATFTNLSRDHLDVHGDLDSYFAAKRSLFADVLAGDGRAVLNRDDDRFDALRACCRERGVAVTTFGRAADADVRLLAAEPSGTGTRVELSVRGRRARVDLDVVGDVMAANACGALATALAAGGRPDRALDALADLRAPPGRLERVGARDGAEAFVDYAHTPAALRAALGALRPRTADDLLLVFGCGGDRDRGKRRRMGEVAASEADAVVVTDDNPRDEDPAAVRADVLAGCPGALERTPRERAVAAALERATDGDVVLVAGKGHERTQVVGDECRTFSDRDVVERLTRGA
jgi:UDP-N-acetylmuramoyl-L-alanyl-D-glutamate--2,6-diaminopimelate ligase